MDKANSTTKTEACMMATGIKIKWMALDHYTISLDNWHIKVCGIMISFKVKANYTTNSRIYYKGSSITKILIKSINFGHTTKVKLYSNSGEFV